MENKASKIVVVVSVCIIAGFRVFKAFGQIRARAALYDALKKEYKAK